ncbi:MAG: hypothetical protein EOP35_02565 [Rubrivivax sp.]|nr:MAG: hypothetical protein EOP35_02565 [Rubrivivax sp.]
MAGLLGAGFGLATLIELQLDTPVYISTAPVDIDYGGNTYIGGRQVSVDVVKSASGTVDKITASLSGVPSEYISLALSTDIIGKRMNVYTAFLDPDTHALAWVDRVWTGQLDQMPIKHGETATIAVTGEHIGIVFARPKGERYTDASQRRLHPGASPPTTADRCLEFLVSQAQHQDIWPSAEWFKK